MDEKSRKKNLILNSAFSLIFQIVALIAGLILPKLKLVYFGSEINGLISSIIQFVSYIALLEAGLSTAASYSMFKPLANKNKEELSVYMSTIQKSYYKISIAFIIASILLAAIYPIFVKIQALSYVQVFLLIFVICLAKALDLLFSSKYIVLLSADQKARVYSIISTFNLVFKTLIITVFSVLQFNIVVIYSILIVSSVFNSVALFFYCRKKYDINFKVKPQKNLLQHRYSAFGGQLVGVFYSSSVIVIATMFLAVKEISVYTVFSLITINVGGFVYMLSNSITPTFGNIIAKCEKESLKNNFSLFDFLHLNISTIVFSCIAILIMPFITLYTSGITDANYIRPLLAFLMTIAAIVQSMATPFDVIANSGGLYKEQFYISIFQTVVVYMLGIIFVFLWGLEGIVGAVIIATICRLFSISILILKKFPVISRIEIIKNRFVNIVVFVICVTSASFIKINIPNYFFWFLYAAITLILVSLVCLIINLLFSRGKVIEVVRKIFRKKLKKEE